MTERNYQPTDSEKLLPPVPWVEDMLELTAFYEALLDHHSTQITEKFRQECIESADATWVMAKLQAGRERYGFHPLPLVDYLQKLAEIVNVSMVNVLERFGIAELSSPTIETVRPFARLAQQIGISLDETLMHFRIGLAELAGYNLMLLSTRRSATGRHSLVGSPTNGPEKKCEQALAEVEAEYDAQQSQELIILKAEVLAVFSEKRSDDFTEVMQ